VRDSGQQELDIIEFSEEARKVVMEIDATTGFLVLAIALAMHARSRLAAQ